MNFDKRNFKYQIFDEVPENISRSNFLRCVFKKATNFTRCNVINCIFEEPCTSDASNIDFDEAKEELYFIAEEDHCIVCLNRTDKINICGTEFSTDGLHWIAVEWDGDRSQYVELENAGDKVYWRNNVTGDIPETSHMNFIISGKVAAGGNVMSMIDAEDFAHLYTIPYAGALSALFYNCRSLTKAPSLPAIHLSDRCYQNMFRNCQSMKEAPELPATELAASCYKNMFNRCWGLESAPVMKFNRIAEGSLDSMFYGCESLIVNSDPIPESNEWKIPYFGKVVNPTDYTYTDVFTGCPGTRVNADDLAFDETGVLTYYIGGTPFEFTGLCFTAEEAGSTIKLHANAHEQFSDVSYSMDGQHWNSVVWTEGETEVVELSAVGDKVYWRANRIAPQVYDYAKFVMTGKIAASGNIMSMITEEGFEEMTAIPYDTCFASLFEGCESLTTAPELPATELSFCCYYSMFSGCTNLTKVPELPSTSLALGCYGMMFCGCSGLIECPSTLPANVLPEEAYISMFEGCTSLTKTPQIMATEADDRACQSMFAGCSALKEVSVLRIIQPSSACYRNMFSGCSSLEVAPVINAVSTKKKCYMNMFKDCTSLTMPPVIECSSITEDCFSGMFNGCTSMAISSISTSPETPVWRIPATGRVDNPTAYAYENTFKGCKGYRDSGANLAFDASEGIAMFYLEDAPEPVVTFTGLCFTAEEAGSTVKLHANAHDQFSDVSYSMDGINWNSVVWTEGDTEIVELPAVGDKVYWRANRIAAQEYDYAEFVMTGKIAASGNIMSMIAEEGFEDMTTIPYDTCFATLFSGCTALTSAPELPARELSFCCYYSMFSGCKNLKKAPELPATTLAEGCYAMMFYGCSGLTECPSVLPANTLPPEAYSNMFEGCISLTKTPQIMATETEMSGCASMFAYCHALKEVSVLRIAQPASSCYKSMFSGCASLEVAPVINTVGTAKKCYMDMFKNCTALTTPPVIEFSSLADGCFKGMFDGCTSMAISSVSTSPETPVWRMPATGNVNNPTAYTYENTFRGCKGYRASGDNLAFDAVEGIAMFYLEDAPEPKVEYPGLGFVAEKPTRIKLTRSGDWIPIRDTAYSLDGETWIPVEWNGDESQIVELRHPGDTVYWRNTFTGNVDEGDFLQFVDLDDSRYAAQGNIMSMYKAEGFEPLRDLEYACCFNLMFSECTGLTHAPDMPAIRLSSWCYYGIYSGCTNLESAPELPATELTDMCYCEMFSGCTSLVDVMEVLPASNIPLWAYSGMFYNCTSITSMPQILATSAEYESCAGMFEGCTSLVNVTPLRVLELTENCYQNMFKNCVSLVRSPELRATKIYDGCYYGMFRNCSSLKYVSDMHFPSLVSYKDFCSMFEGCTSLMVNTGATSMTPYKWTIPCTGRVSNPSIQCNDTFKGCPGARSTNDKLIFNTSTGVAEYYLENPPISIG